MNLDTNFGKHLSYIEMYNSAVYRNGEFDELVYISIGKHLTIEFINTLPLLCFVKVYNDKTEYDNAYRLVLEQFYNLEHYLKHYQIAPIKYKRTSLSAQRLLDKAYFYYDELQKIHTTP